MIVHKCVFGDMNLFYFIKQINEAERNMKKGVRTTQLPCPCLALILSEPSTPAVSAAPISVKEVKDSVKGISMKNRERK